MLYSRYILPKTLAIAALCMIGAIPLVGATDAKKQPAPNTVAVFNGAQINEDELEKAAAADLANLELQRQQMTANYQRTKHQILERNLSRLLEDKILVAEAAKRGIPKEELIKKEIDSRVKEPSIEDVNTFYEANKQRFGQPLEQVSVKIQQYLRSQSYDKARFDFVERLKKDYGITVMLEPFRMKVETTGSPSLGPVNAPVKIVEFSDFQCPYCSRLSTTLEAVLAKYGKEVQLVYRHFPLSDIHPYAEKAAEASICAADQGHFWEMSHLLFQSQNQLTDEDLKAKAAKLNLDSNAFVQCLSSGKNNSKVTQDFNDGIRLGVGSTPSLFINGRFLSGVAQLADISRIIDEEVQKKNLSAAGPDKK
jgi:protein-disulfide isomerase